MLIGRFESGEGMAETSLPDTFRRLRYNNKYALVFTSLKKLPSLLREKIVKVNNNKLIHERTALENLMNIG